MGRRVTVLAFLAALLVGTVAPVADAASRSSVRVAIIVGPVGSITDSYRSQAEAAAREARKWSSDVVTVYSPDATWPAVQRALQGASIVIYMGHGNGWPSPYRDSLYPPTQNGLGLNPVAGVDDSAHQYFGEAYLARSVRLAPGAIVLLNHLCYASGNSEPGLPEGSLDQGRQRVDNYAAGWIAAGASAVVAEAHSSPLYYVRALLSGRRDVEQVWRSAPTFNDHVLTFASQRSTGATALMDPDRPTSGFYRSLVVVGRAVSRGGDGGARAVPIGPAPAPSLAALGIRFGTPDLDATPIAGSQRQVILPVTLPPSGKLDKGVQVGLRWEVLALDGVLPAASAEPDAVTPSPTATDDAATSAIPPAAPLPSGSPASPAHPAASADPLGPTPSPDAAATPGPATQDPLPEPPEVQLVSAESASDVVDVVKATRTNDGLTVPVTVPAVPGRYRLVLSLHDRDGVAYDAATQALVPDLSVRVTGSISAAYSVASDVTVEATRPFTLPVRVANTGDVAWGFGSAPAPDAEVPDAGARPTSVAVPWVMGHWVRLVGVNGTPMRDGGVPVLVQTGESTLAPLDLVAPTDPGSYLLVIDTVTPAQGSLAALGVPPAVVRVTVVPPLPEASTRPK